MGEHKGTGIWFCDSEDELNEHERELQGNSDFSFLGDYDMIQDIFYELEELGFREREILDMSNNRYGDCLEILEYNNRYTAYIGQR